ncbi:hypothetical protein D4Z93_03590 [Clostridium fermenticellae]|uniref:Uncharacterized protein n=1 Tax=Clostridium fermenticellae TaxID=2068654 RepID=A0A386H1R4_9CLOT|nr:hypothetical protein [Clostridium fermenticellae]AYD39651.1 hypothetical protein D4Z93_03590 [Clostridium fermenticellae]
MHIEKQYLYHRHEFTDYFCVKISVRENSQDNILFLRNTDDLVDEGASWISIRNLNDEEFLKQHKIEYIIKEDQLNKNREIIPIGLFEFNDKDNFCDCELLLWNIGSKDLYDFEHIIKNIEDAIKIKYNALKLKKKCIENKKEDIELD